MVGAREARRHVHEHEGQEEDESAEGEQEEADEERGADREDHAAQGDAEAHAAHAEAHGHEDHAHISKALQACFANPFGVFLPYLLRFIDQRDGARRARDENGAHHRHAALEDT